MAERILVVDDEPGVRSALEAILGDEGFVVASADSGEAGLDLLERSSFDAVLLDVWLPGIDGLETLKRMRDTRLDAQVVMISGHGTIETAVRATKLGAFDFVEKPLSLEKTLLVLRNALRQRRLERTNLRLLEQLARDTEITGGSPAAVRLRAAVDLVAGSDGPVLIAGEPGSGRETVARRIHADSARDDAPFVEVPCGALDAAACASALFGQGERPGRIALARGGTLFLEDVDRVDPALQRRIAAALSPRGRAEQGLRVVASCAPAPDGLHAELRQCLEVARIDVPPLRERREDVPRLAERFMRDLSREYGREAKRFDPDGLAALTAHDWPGNVRELRNVVERLLLFVAEETVGRGQLPEELGGAPGPTDDLYRPFPSLAEGVRAYERYWIRRALDEEGGDPARAAARLGLDEDDLTARLGGPLAT